jgi:Tol biopolymer transport system component
LLICCGTASAERWKPFANPQPVTIQGYPGSAAEPFISPDGRYLLFNSSESSPNFSLQYATRVGAQTFEYQGTIRGEGVNDPEALSGTPTLDQEGNLYFISTRSYFQTLSTVYSGHFSGGEATGVHLAPGVSAPRLGKVHFDVGVSPDGSVLYVSEGQFGGGGPPTSARIVMFDKRGGEFVEDLAGEAILSAVNQVAALNYAADPSYDGLELFFTAAAPALGQAPAIYRATRTSTSASFGHVARVAAITGFAEAPSISADGTTLYYHEQTGSEMHVMTVARDEVLPTVTKAAPRVGRAAGGTTVAITGSNLTGARRVKFGSTDASSFAVTSSTSIVAVSPAGTRGTIDVTVTNEGGTSLPSRKDHFRYVKH